MPAGQRVLSLVCAAALLSSCASSGLPRRLHPASSDPLATLVIQSPFGASPDEDVLALDNVQGWLVETFGPGHSSTPRTLRRLASMLSEGGELGIRYGPLAVHGAAETFRTREGNCLSQTTLFVAMARALGMRAYFREVYQAPDWIREGDMRIKNHHVAARVHIRERGSWEVDFGEARPNPEALGRALSDVQARAHHFNNLGAAALTRNANEEAIRHFNRALLLDPRMAFGWGNLGTAYLRLNKMGEAEVALREAARLDPYDVVALYGLERLYTLEGAENLADEMRTLSKKVRDQDPFRQHEQGLLALEEGRPKAAVQHLERALEGLPSLVEVRTDLARAYYRAEQFKRAQRTFREAHDLARTNDERNDVKQALLSLTKENGGTSRPSPAGQTNIWVSGPGDR